ncbi:MAG: hypothetical protein KDD56_09675, partial [Bdellovibrionales bacterium]|nr:hypothetical protein [Bdellovibrionales bacterium]
LKKNEVKSHAFLSFDGEIFNSFVTESRRYSIAPQASFSINLNKHVRARVNNLIPGITLIAKSNESDDNEAIIFLRGYEVAYRGVGKQAVMLIEGSAKYTEVSKPYALLSNGMVYLESAGKKTAVRSGSLGILQEPPKHQCLSDKAIFLNDQGVKKLLALKAAKQDVKTESLKKLSELLQQARNKASPIIGSIILQVVDSSLILFDYTSKPEKVKFIDFLGETNEQILCSVEDFEI